MRRPTETITAALGGVCSAVFVLLGAFGLSVPAAVPGAVLGLLAATAPLVTQIVAKRQRGGGAASGIDGTVIKGP